ncbi:MULTISPECIES: TraB/GumN family protein [unclassified Oceanobacillus]|uniref:TraB/GumN family protein n=1 Tax=unclassified Oceanobacillus TaxID=2630292 RepID=UPI001BEA98E8|nr:MULTISPECIES: TraB/GumN family protein [unclassified Oceanobacillus]MBT2599005.1 TraB/GumN family protein [Oceanobacillus sp. ISL-74]MBT2651924.1 TraB/GumN family protein [Oceanobacillus sp. ISL-73]
MTYDYDGNGGLLWKIVNGETTLYVQGIIHVGHEDFYPLANAIEEAYDSANVILPEINVVEPEVNAEEINKLALFSEGMTLDKVLSPKSLKKLSGILEAQELSLENFNKYQPWYIESILGAFIREKSDLRPEYGVDLYFLKRALEDGKEIIELETVEDQYNVFSSYNLDTQVKMLEHTIQTFEQQADWINQLGYSWVHSNSSSSKEELINIVTNDLNRADDEYQKEMNDTRNINMVNKLDEILQSEIRQTYFVIVGSGHTVIDPSILSEFREKGYNVKSIY